MLFVLTKKNHIYSKQHMLYYPWIASFFVKLSLHLLQHGILLSNYWLSILFMKVFEQFHVENISTFICKYVRMHVCTYFCETVFFSKGYRKMILFLQNILTKWILIFFTRRHSSFIQRYLNLQTWVSGLSLIYILNRIKQRKLEKQPFFTSKIAYCKIEIKL